MAMPTVSIAGQKANQDQGQAPASKGDGGYIAMALETTPKGRDHCGGDQNGHHNMKTCSEGGFKPCQCGHAGKQKG